MEEQNELMVSEDTAMIAEENTEETSSGCGKALAAGIAIGTLGILAGKLLWKKGIKPLVRKLKEKHCGTEIPASDVTIADAESDSAEDDVPKEE